MARTNKLKNSVKRIVIYGPSGSGKTTFAGTFPNPVFIDLDNGMLSLQDKDIEYYTIDEKPTTDPDAIKILGDRLATKGDAYTKTVELLEHFLNTLDKDSTLVLDSLSLFSDYALEKVLALESVKSPRIQDWGSSQKLIEKTMQLLRQGQCNIIVIAHEQFVKDEDSGMISWLPLTIGKLASKLPLYFDEVYHSYVERGKGTKKGEVIYGIETTPTRRTTAKSRCKLSGNIEFPTFEKLYK